MKTTKEKIEELEVARLALIDIERKGSRTKEIIKCIEDEIFILKSTIKPAQTLKERIEAEYGDYDVVMLEWICNHLSISDKNVTWSHMQAQSMKGFYKYVYERSDGTLHCARNPAIEDEEKTIQPVAVLFYKQEEEK